MLGQQYFFQFPPLTVNLKKKKKKKTGIKNSQKHLYIINLYVYIIYMHI